MKNKEKIKKFIQYLIVFFCILVIIKYFWNYKEELLVIKKIKPTHILNLSVLMIILNVILSHKFFIILKNLNLKNIKYLDWFKIFIVSRRSKPLSHC